MALAIDGANRHDMKMVLATLEDLARWSQAWQGGQSGLCMDKGYDYDEVRQIVAQYGLVAHIRGRGEEAVKIKRERFRARRWVVERAHSWINRFRGLLIRWSKKAENYLGLLHFACGLIAWRATGLLG